LRRATPSVIDILRPNSPTSVAGWRIAVIQSYGAGTPIGVTAAFLQPMGTIGNAPRANHARQIQLGFKMYW